MSNHIVTEIDFSYLNPNDLVMVNADKTGFDPVLVSENLQLKEVVGSMVLDTTIREYDETKTWRIGNSKTVWTKYKPSYLRVVFVNGVKLKKEEYVFAEPNAVEVKKILKDGDEIAIHYQHNLKDPLIEVEVSVSKINIQSFK